MKAKKRNFTDKTGARHTSWQGVSKWYADSTKDAGHYYHKHVIIPQVLQLLALQKKDSVLDLACGSGVLGRAIPREIDYIGIDIAPSLIDEAKKQDNQQNHHYVYGDVTKHTLTTPDGSFRQFSHVTCILALQNMKEQSKVIKTAAKHIKNGGMFIMVLNHPAFRIPRQSSWGVDEENKMQYRKVNRYMSPLEIPLTMHPGKGKQSPLTWSYHYPLSSYSTWLKQEGFVIRDIAEWTSDKESYGSAKHMENRARNEFPLFLCITAQKIPIYEWRKS